MSIFTTPDGQPIGRDPLGKPIDRSMPADASPEWRQVPGRPKGIEIHRDGKTMRNVASTPGL